MTKPLKTKTPLSFVVLLTFLGVACNLPVVAVRLTPAVGPTPSATLFTAEATLPPADATDQGVCGYQWATNPLPDLSTQLQEMFDQAGKRNLRVVAEAYGETCIREDGSPGAFSVMETDVKFQLDVDSLTDRSALADQAREILRILDGIPQEQFPGPNPGYVGITFQTPDQATQAYWFPKQTGLEAFRQGLSGAELLLALQEASN